MTVRDVTGAPYIACADRRIVSFSLPADACGCGDPIRTFVSVATSELTVRTPDCTGTYKTGVYRVCASAGVYRAFGSFLL